MKPFTYDALPGRVVFGVESSRRLPEEVDRLGVSRLLMIYDVPMKDVARELADALGDRVASEFTDIQQHVPKEAVDRAADLAREVGADGAVTIGGGSTTGFGKVVALELDAPFSRSPRRTRARR